MACVQFAPPQAIKAASSGCEWSKLGIVNKQDSKVCPGDSFGPVAVVASQPLEELDEEDDDELLLLDEDDEELLLEEDVPDWSSFLAAKSATTRARSGLCCRRILSHLADILGRPFSACFQTYRVKEQSL
ncbi:MAG: hypothetical protein HETSPECPRED_006345 [Heterodermia speciosa]|uniref:Uncharacterized protein n=1 Tax=Heterodermia speciosa TaxID=116794 RepID=A0A8H3IPA9_9LECA|nr:MAG: hypothetical protein HETSPECPRED_006345 [Heterodermia speciosa]